jgi:tetratricopeptide (TPR) repeat protein
MTRLRIVLLAAGLFLGPALHAQASASGRTAAWRADLDSLVVRIQRVHPRPWAHVSREAFLRQAAQLRSAVPKRTDGELLAGLLRLTASLQDGHTGVTDLGPAGGRWFPVRFHQFADGVWITGIAPEASELAGARVLRLGSTSAEDAVARILPLVSGDNEFGRREGIPLLANAVLLKALGIVASEDSLPLTVETASGRRQTTLHSIVTSNGDLSWPQYGEMDGPPKVSLVTAFGGRNAGGYLDPDSNPDLPVHLRGRRAYWWTVLLEDSTVYLQINSLTAESRYSPISLFATLEQALGHVDSAAERSSRFILDLRYNSGGDGSLVPRIVNAFVKREGSIGRRGRFFVIVGRKTFSAAADLAIDLMRHTQAIFVGEPMGAPFNASGDAAHSMLPHHQIDVGISSNNVQTAKLDSIRVIPVQIPASMTGVTYFAGGDPALAAILSRPAPYADILTTLQERGAAAAHALWGEMRRAYGDLPWWRPFTLGELNELSYRLLGEHRTDDAIAGFELNTEQYPGAWETWDSLGDGYKAAGRGADAKAAYQHALRIAPDNWNAEYEKRMVTELGS